MNGGQFFSSNLTTDQRDSFWIEGVLVGTLVYYILIFLTVLVLYHRCNGHELGQTYGEGVCNVSAHRNYCDYRNIQILIFIFISE